MHNNLDKFEFQPDRTEELKCPHGFIMALR